MKALNTSKFKELNEIELIKKLLNKNKQEKKIDIYDDIFSTKKRKREEINLASFITSFEKFHNQLIPLGYKFHLLDMLGIEEITKTKLTSQNRGYLIRKNKS